MFISRDVVFDETVFPSSALPSSSTPPSHHSSPVMPDQFEDVAYSPLLLPNHGVGIGRESRLQIVDIIDVPPTSPVATEPAREVSSLSSIDWSLQVHGPPPPVVSFSASTSASDLAPPAAFSVPNPPNGPPSSVGLESPDAPGRADALIRPKRIYNFLCSMLVLTPFA
jgi:hypothetical protein